MDDLISRQAAIAIASGYCNSANIAKELAKLPSVQPEVNCQKCIFCGFAGFKQFQTAQPEIIRCKECKYYEIAWLKKDGTDDERYKPSICVRGQYGITRKPDFYCAYAERKGEQE